MVGSWAAQLISSLLRGPNIEFAGTWSKPTSVAVMTGVTSAWASASYAVSGAPEYESASPNRSGWRAA